MADIFKSQLSDSLKSYLETLGLSEDQVKNIIKSIIGNLEDLQTLTNTSLVGAINENAADIAALRTEMQDAKSALIEACNKLTEL